MVTYGDRAVLLPQNIYTLFAGLIVYSLIFMAFWKITFKFTSKGFKYYIWPVLIISTLLQLLIIYLFRIKLTADWEVVHNISKQIAAGDYSGLAKGGYLFAYPNNLGLSLYFFIANFISRNSLLILRLLNVLWTLVTLVYLNKLFILLAPEYKEEKIRFLLFTMLFIPALFMSNLVYNEVLSTMLYLLSTYWIVKFTKTKKYSDLIITIVFLSLANFIRGIGLLFFAAFLIYLLLLKVKWRQIAIFLFLSLVGLFLPLSIFNLQFIKTGKISEPLGKNSAPVSKWIHIGLNREFMGYWDQGESYWMYADDADWDKEKANKMFITDLKQRIGDYGIIGFAELFYKKNVWLWSEGTYQSVYLGMSHSSPGGYVEETKVSKLFAGNEKLRDIFKLPMYYGNLFSLAVITIFLSMIIVKRRWNLVGDEVLFVIILTLFILFYTLWEVKPRYIYPIYPYILLLTYLYFSKLEKLIKRKKY